MITSEFPDYLLANLQKLPRDRVIDFAINICERLLPYYKNFNDKYGWGDFELLKEVIATVQNRMLKPTQIKKLIHKVDAVTPDTEDFGDYDGSYALNASVAVLELLEYLTDYKLEHILNISTCITDTIDFELTEQDSTLTNEELINHPVLINELTRQLEVTKR